MTPIVGVRHNAQAERRIGVADPSLAKGKVISHLLKKQSVAIVAGVGEHFLYGQSFDFPPASLR